MKSKYFKFTKTFLNSEKQGLLEHFKELNDSDVFEILDVKYVSDDDDLFGVTKIKNTNTQEVFNIKELNFLLEKTEYSWWCFICSEFPNEYEEVEYNGD